MKRSGTALSFLLSEVSSGGGLVQAMEEGGPNTPPTQKHTELSGDTLIGGKTKARRGQYKSGAQSRCPA